MICNAWGVFDPTLEFPRVPYANNPLHPVAIALQWLQNLCADIVFAAGNCGEFCPNDRCHRGLHRFRAAASMAPTPLTWC